MTKTISIPTFTDDNDDLLPDPQVAKRYGVTSRTLYRWDEDPNLGFPAAVRIKKRKYRSLRKLREFEIKRAAASQAA
jgi:hypothetical protein